LNNCGNYPGLCGEAANLGCAHTAAKRRSGRGARELVLLVACERERERARPTKRRQDAAAVAMALCSCSCACPFLACVAGAHQVWSFGRGNWERGWRPIVPYLCACL